MEEYFFFFNLKMKKIRQSFQLLFYSNLTQGYLQTGTNLYDTCIMGQYLKFILTITDMPSEDQSQIY